MEHSVAQGEGIVVGAVTDHVHPTVNEGSILLNRNIHLIENYLDKI